MPTQRRTRAGTRTDKGADHVTAEAAAPGATDARPADRAVDMMPPADDRDAQALEALVSDYADRGYTLRVERESVDRGRSIFKHVGTIDLSADFVDQVAQRFGGGTFRARVFRGNDYVQRVSFAIEGEPIVERRGAPLADVAAAAPAAAAPQLTELVSAFGAMLAQTVDRVAQLVAKPASSSDSLEDALKVVRIARELAPPVAPAPAAGGADTLAIIDKVLGIRDRILDTAEAPAKASTADKMLERGVLPVIGLLAERLTKETPAPAAAPASPTPAGSAVVPAAPAPAPAADVPLDPFAALAARIPLTARVLLANAAKNDGDPASYANLVVDTLSDADLAQLAELVVGDDFAPRLCAAVPQWGACGAWFARLGAELRGVLVVADDETPDDARASA